jgi:hypothetical protein
MHLLTQTTVETCMYSLWTNTLKNEVLCFCRVQLFHDCVNNLTEPHLMPVNCPNLAVEAAESGRFRTI